ncbi:hypothetical protein [Lentzea sp. E54]|uniref:hypothetical protein n=1 Tax=Lentzea xerophila TaxID=3435883 RepID=UPI003DA251D6
MSTAVRSAVLGSLLVVLIGFLSGCNLFVEYYEDVDNVGKTIVADWKEMPEVVDAKYDYTHGVDSGQRMALEVVIRAESVSDEVIDKLREVAERDYWLGTTRKVSMHFAAYSSDNPPRDDDLSTDRAIRVEDVGVPEKVGLEKYGPRPTR